VDTTPKIRGLLNMKLVDKAYGEFRKIIMDGLNQEEIEVLEHWVKAAFQAGWATAVGNISISKDNAKQVFTETKEFLVSKEWETKRL